MTRKEFEEILRYEKKIYIKSTTSGFLLWLYHDERYFFYRYLRMLRYEEYYLTKSSLFARVMAALYRRKRNAIGNMVDIKIVPFFAGKGVNIHHKGVIINGHVGEDCIFHGRNTIGNNTVGGGSNRCTFNWKSR